jgi:hypothetical protein
MARYSLAKYRTEARKEPFVLDVDDDHSITIEAPTTDVALRIAELTSPRPIVRLLLGDAYDEVMALIGGDQSGVLAKLLDDLRDHFGIGEGEAGASRT